MELADFMDAGIAPDHFFREKKKYAIKYKHKSEQLYSHIVKRFENGEKLASIFAGNRYSENRGNDKEIYYNLVPEIEVLLISAGEKDGNVSKALYRAKFLAESSVRLKKAFLKPLMYPLFLMVLIIGMLNFSHRYMFVEVKKIVPMDIFPTWAIVFSDIAAFFSNNIILVILFFILMIGSMIYSLPRLSGTFRNYLDRFLPPYSFYKPLQSAGFLVSFSSLFSSGLTPVDTINTLKIYSSHYMNGFFNKMLSVEKRTKKLDELLNVGLVLRVFFL